MKGKKIILVGGARPNFVKLAALLKAFQADRVFTPVLVHTGQHYDYEMSESFFRDLDIKAPDYFLGIGSGTHSEQTAKALVEFEKVCVKESPGLVVVVGDVNSTLACTIAAKKLHIRVAHVEAGLRSFDLAMPEEINRIVTDSIADYLFVTEESGIRNLKKEGKSADSMFFVGNTMVDTLIFGLDKLRNMDLYGSSAYKVKQKYGDYAVVTLHRPVNVDNKKQFLKLAEVLNRISRMIPVVFPMHPRTVKNVGKFKIKFNSDISILKPLGYLEFLFLYKDSEFVMTDSGGMQEETTFLKIPCFTLRDTTERPVTVTKGTNIIVGDKIGSLPGLVSKVLKNDSGPRKVKPRFWDGKSAQRIARILKSKV